jgi:hypothetical protein
MGEESVEAEAQWGDGWMGVSFPCPWSAGAFWFRVAGVSFPLQNCECFLRFGPLKKLQFWDSATGATTVLDFVVNNTTRA